MNHANSKFHNLTEKFLTKEVILYVVFGVFTTIVNVGTFFVLTTYLNFNENSANIIAILLAVFFAYITNRKLVFNSTASNIKQVFIEICKFFSARFFTMLVEFFGFMLLFDVLHIPNLISKLSITVLVIALNFFLSKFFAFKK